MYGCMIHNDGMIQENKHFQYLILNKASFNTISRSSNLIEGSGRANIILSKIKRKRKLYCRCFAFF
jgi:hypothetical protein